MSDDATPAPALVPAEAVPARGPAGDDDRAPGSADAAGDSATDVAPGTGQRVRSRPIRDIAVSLLVLVVPLVALVALCGPGADEVPAIDASRSYAGARAEAGFPVREPRLLLDGWKATNAAYRTNPNKTSTLRVSYLTPEGRFIQLIQSDVPADRLLPDELGGGAPRGAASIDGAAWQRYGAGRADDRAYVLLDRRVTVIAVGDAPDRDFQTFLATLREP